MNVTYTIDAVQDDIPVRGNAMASGDPKADKRCEDEILRRLDNGDVWAWAYVTVRASVTVDGTEFWGAAGLGGCSYQDEKEFRMDPYFSDLCWEAWADLIAKAKEDIARASKAITAVGLALLEKS